MEYIIAGIRIAVPQEFTAGSFGTALAPFAAADEGPADLSVETRGEIRQADGYRELDEFDFADADADCRFGRDSEGYLLTMTPRDGCAAARFRKAFGAPLVTTDVTLRHNPALFRFGLWSMFNIAAVARQAVAIHSSVISLNGGAVLFLGESGTGKSTHTRLWREHIPGAELLNDDSPIVRIVQTADADPICGAVQNPADAPAAAAETPDASAATTGAPKPQAMVFGAPWSGKTPCYRNVCQPIRAIVRLSQAPHNRIRRLRAIEAIGALLPSCPPSFAHDETLEDAVCATVSAVVAQVPVYHLECRPDAAAASIMEGSIVLMVDNSPSVMILPTGFFDFTQESNDYYFPPLVGTYLRVLRVTVFLLSLFITPAWYLMVSEPNRLPGWLNFLSSPEPVSLSLLSQLLVVEFLIDVLKLASLNTPDSLSNSFSMLGALVLGDFAVQAGWLGPEVLVYMAFVSVAGFAQPSYELGYAFKLLRVALLLVTAAFDVWGFCLGVVGIFVLLCTTKPLVGKGYLYPLVPFNGKALLRLLVREPISRDNT